LSKTNRGKKNVTTEDICLSSYKEIPQLSVSPPFYQHRYCIKLLICRPNLHITTTLTTNISFFTLSLHYPADERRFCVR